MKTILVMGGATFVSSSLAKYLIKQGYTVDILTRGLRSIDYNGFREHLICDRKLSREMQQVLKDRKYDFVFDISAYTEDDIKILMNSMETSLLKKYIFCSSGAVYKPSDVAVNESFERGENQNWGSYGMDKKAAEDLIMGSELPYIIFRPTYIYGENNNLYREVYFFDRILNSMAIPLPVGKNTITQFIHIEDLIRVFESAMFIEATSKVYNVTNPEAITWADLISCCGEVVGKKPIFKQIDINKVKLEPREYFPFRDVTYILDISKLIEDGLHTPTITLKNGLQRTYKWYKDNSPNVNDLRMMSKVEELSVD